MSSRTRRLYKPPPSAYHFPMKAWSIILLATAALSIFVLLQLLRPDATTAVERSTGTALIGGPFEAIDHTGERFTDADLKGQYSLVYFGFTHCPDVCPTGLLKISNVMDSLGGIAEKLVPIFITLDPERDTPEVMAQYVQHFDDRMIGVTGTAEQIDTIAKAYKVYYKKSEQADSALGYLVDHSSFTYLMGPDGNYITHFSHDASDSEMHMGILKALEEK